MNLFKLIFPDQPQNLCVLPARQVRPVKGTPSKQQDSMFVIDPERQHFGFHLNSDGTEREGAENWLTGFDKQVIAERDLSGGKKVTAQNERCKTLWCEGETVAQCTKTMRLSGSWVEKRFAAFGAALNQENDLKK